MKKRFFLHISLLVTSLSIAGCATPSNTDVAVDACMLTKPPKEAIVEDMPHIGEIYKYPGKLATNYSGCKKIWINNHLLFSIVVDNGNVSRIEFFDPDGDKAPEICNYDKDKKLITGSSSECTTYSDLHDDLWKK